jgi:hypothetical protein
MDMANRVTQLSVATFGTVVAGFALGAISVTTVAAKDCLTAPGGPAASGQHWYYRIEHPSNRHCWYVRDEGQAAAKDAPQIAADAARPDTAPASAALQRTVADARAEMAPAGIAPPDSTNASPTVAATTSTDAAARGPSRPGSIPGISLADRWSDHPAANDPVQNASSGVIAHVSASVRPAHPAAEDAALSWWVMASEGVGALALIGMAALLIVYYRRGIEIENSDESGQDSATWDPPVVDGGSPPASDEVPMNWIRIARETQKINQQRDEVERLLSASRERPAMV